MRKFIPHCVIFFCSVTTVFKNAVLHSWFPSHDPLLLVARSLNETSHQKCCISTRMCVHGRHVFP